MVENWVCTCPDSEGTCPRHEKRNAETIGNSHGYLCPKCKGGEELRISANVWAALFPDGTDSSDSDTEWDENSRAMCMVENCDWEGKVSDLITVKLED